MHLASRCWLAGRAPAAVWNRAASSLHSGDARIRHLAGQSRAAGRQEGIVVLRQPVLRRNGVRQRADPIVYANIRRPAGQLRRQWGKQRLLFRRQLISRAVRGVSGILLRERRSSSPGVPSAFTMCFDRRLSTLSPVFGSYVAKMWSNVRFSPTITITCWIGVRARFPPSPSCSFACALPTNGPARPICNITSDARPTRAPCLTWDAIRFADMRTTSSFLFWSGRSTLPALRFCQILLV